MRPSGRRRPRGARIVPGAGPAAPPDATGTSGAARPVTEATCATAPLGVRVVAVRRETADSIRVELTLANLAPAGAWTPGSPAAASVQAAVEALEGLSLLSADGRRRMFALRGSTGQRVGSRGPGAGARQAGDVLGRVPGRGRPGQPPPAWFRAALRAGRRASVPGRSEP